jgi:PBP1b-binding outer membrane lipoprotein LpoB
MFRAVIILTLAIVLAGCSAKTSCKVKPGVDIDVENIQTIDDLKNPNVTPKGELACSF